MSTDFVVAAKNNPSKFTHRVSEDDAVTFTVDFTPWQEDNSNITSVTWTLESGSAAISGQNLTSGIASALVTFSDSGRNIISVLATTASEKKKVWIDIEATDQDKFIDDYGSDT
jgi:hypothetical protein